MMEPKKVLIVEDDTPTGIRISEKLKMANYATHLATSGEACFDALKADKFDVVLLDVVLPGISGIKVLTQIRQQYEKFQLPVIMATAKESPEDIVEALLLGANDYITKPIILEVAIARIRTQLEMVRLHKSELQKKELETLNTMICTYNHEINNALVSVVASIEKGLKDPDVKNFEKTKIAVSRITTIVRKIGDLMDSNPNTESYTDGINRITFK